MPYHKDKQQAFQAAEQGVQEVRDLYEEIDETAPEYGAYVKRIKKEINEAQQQIEKALTVAGERQKQVLEQMREEVAELDSQFP